jgi:polyisoprenoid-binding protein YceI
MQTQSAPTTAADLDSRLKAGSLAGDWVLDSRQSSIGLKSSVLGFVSVKGVFREVSGSGSVTSQGTVSGSVTVAAASIDTKNARRDTHLRSADFFDSDNNPDITFVVHSTRPSGEGAAVTGSLAVRDRTRPLSFYAAVSGLRDDEICLDAEVGINREDYGLTWNLLGMVSVNNTLTIHAVFSKR